ncbi:maltose acetyltransferase domain-containing protein [Pediococcus pentosaceus]|jgi:maltose O-acetyltransferase|uniref:maltose acetyltransferase domain-containing protein n=1 Tax=Pediococcus pentosaceus TaxID=1255 RepID=UPI0003C33988|nr:maltose acetyltransferase domain-containing protein [Pediococcus pentosaceus]AHA05879.1 hypothetical protein T256_00445 [Pediococcus pentosaceus SL4]MCH4015906.1 hypothetical protein [Pediococcus pentosaceus]MCH4098334.1 hypothetical protein [Pediococcus pentosaceus]MCI1472525.1 hypothetical protein [Pediococcus pentosaceus]MDD1388640.1 maltose acetyltransferase domain-containing protein [Pediococcus pentosaceus]
MKEIEKLKQGLEYRFLDEEVANLKQAALIKCARFNNIDPTDDQKQQAAIKDLFGSTGTNVFGEH